MTIRVLTWGVFTLMLLAALANGPPEKKPRRDRPAEPPPPELEEPPPPRPTGRDAPLVETSVAVTLILVALLILFLVWTGR